MNLHFRTYICISYLAERKKRDYFYYPEFTKILFMFRDTIDSAQVGSTAIAKLKITQEGQAFLSLFTEMSEPRIFTLEKEKYVAEALRPVPFDDSSNEHLELSVVFFSVSIARRERSRARGIVSFES